MGDAGQQGQTRSMWRGFRALAASVAFALIVPAVAQAGWDTYIGRGIGEGRLFAFDSETGESRGSVASQSLTTSLAVTPDGGSIFGVHFSSFDEGVLSEHQGIGDDSPFLAAVGSGSYGIAISPDGRWVAVAYRSGGISVLDRDSNSVSNVTVADEPERVAFDPDGHYAYVADLDQPEVAVLDATAGFAMVDEIDTGLSGQNDENTVTGIAVTPDGERLVVAGAHAREVRIIDLETHDATVVSLADEPHPPWWVGVSPDGKRAYALLQDPTPPFLSSGVVTIDLEAAEVLESVPFEGAWGEPALTPDGRRLILPSVGPAGEDGSGWVGYYDTQTAEIKGLTQLSEPSAAAVAPNQAPVPDLNAPATGYAGVPVTFDASGSADDNGIERFEFDFGDGSGANGSQAIRAHTFEDPGTYHASVTVDDGSGCEDSVYTGQVMLCNEGAVAQSETVEIQIDELPRLRLRAGLERPQSSLSRVRASAICLNIGCEVRARGRVRVTLPGGKRRAFALEPDTGELAADSESSLEPRLTAAARRAARKALRKGGVVRARVRIAAEALGGQKRVRVRQARIAR